MLGQMKIWRTVVLVAMMATMVGCGEPPVVTGPEPKPDIKENLANANRYIVESEETQINSYVERRGWKVKRLACGARVYEFEMGNGKPVEWEEDVVIGYKLESLTGNTIYEGVKDTVKVGRQKPTLGLDAALTQLKHGSKAYVIVPSNQGYGVVGDGDRVTSRMVLVYKLEIE